MLLLQISQIVCGKRIILPFLPCYQKTFVPGFFLPSKLVRYLDPGFLGIQFLFFGFFQTLFDHSASDHTDYAYLSQKPVITPRQCESEQSAGEKPKSTLSLAF